MAGRIDGRALRAEIQKLVRRLGVLSDDKTPCGKDLPLSDAHALHLLRDHGPLSQSALQALLGIDKSNVSRLRARLEAAGRVEAIAARADGRPITLLAMTPAGRKLARQLDVASAERFAHLLRQIPDPRHQRVVAALDDLNAALARIDPDAPHAAAAVKQARSVMHDERNLLTEREWQVLRLVARGSTSRQVAARLAIGTRTVETHRAKIFRKLQLGSHADLVRFAAAKGLVRRRRAR